MVAPVALTVVSADAVMSAGQLRTPARKLREQFVPEVNHERHHRHGNDGAMNAESIIHEWRSPANVSHFSAVAASPFDHQLIIAGRESAAVIATTTAATLSLVERPCLRLIMSCCCMI